MIEIGIEQLMEGQGKFFLFSGLVFSVCSFRVASFGPLLNHRAGRLPVALAAALARRSRDKRGKGGGFAG